MSNQDKLVSLNSLKEYNKQMKEKYIDPVESIVKGANQAFAVERYSDLLDDTKFLYKDRTRFKVGQNIYIKDLNVPDLWVYSVNSNYTNPVAFTDEESILNTLSTDGKVSIGYYTLALLETQKVDLTNYLEKTTSGNAYARAYTANVLGVQTMTPISTNAVADSLVKRTSDGFIGAQTPTQPAHVATKNYVDTVAGSKQNKLTTGDGISISATTNTISVDMQTVYETIRDNIFDFDPNTGTLTLNI